MTTPPDVRCVTCGHPLSDLLHEQDCGSAENCAHDHPDEPHGYHAFHPPDVRCETCGGELTGADLDPTDVGWCASCDKWTVARPPEQQPAPLSAAERDLVSTQYALEATMAERDALRALVANAVELRALLGDTEAFDQLARAALGEQPTERRTP